MKILRKIANLYEKHKKVIDIVIFASVLISYFLVLVTSEFKLDDLIYMNKWNSNELISSFKDIVIYQYNHYFQWGGRTVAHSILQVLLIIEKPISAFIITIGFLSVSILIYKIIRTNEKIDLLKVSFIMGILYFLNSSSSETLFWYTGIANYLLTTLLILLSFYPFILVLKGIKLRKIHYLMIPLSFLAGWCNENTSTTLVLMMIVVIFYNKKKNGINKPLVFSLIFALIGCAFLILAPGNFARANTFTQGIMGILYRGHGQVNAWFNWLLLPIVTWIATLDFKNNSTDLIENKIFISWAILSILVMLVSPSFPSRATFGSFVLLVISIFSNSERNTNIDSEKRDIIYILVSVGFIFTCCSIAILQIVRNMGVYIPG